MAGLTVAEVTPTTAALEAKVNPQGKATGYQFLYGTADCAATPSSCTKTPEGEVPSGSSPVTVKVPVGGLAPATVYHFLVEAHNTEGSAKSSEGLFATYAPPLAGLPDGRAYEQASPVDKDGGDAVATQALVKAPPDGNGISFGSTFGIPGGKGAGALPTYLASRGAGEVGWSTQGLLPPVSTGERDRLVGWLGDFSESFTRVIKLGEPRTEALIGQSTTDGAVTVIGPYAPQALYSYAGASQDGSTVLFEAHVRLPAKPGGPLLEGSVEGSSNLYAWDRETGEVHLAGVLNDGKAPGEGSFAGPYDWALGTSAFNLREGGGARSYYLQDTHAIAPDGSVYFTAAGTGQLYLRENPTQPQSELNGEGKCKDEALACTIHVSASKRTKADPAGEQPAAFQAASADGSKVFFTSPQMLTDDAYTGPEQPEARISRTGIGGGAVADPDFIAKRAIGVAVAGSHLYWADPAAGAIARSDLNGENIEPAFLAIPESIDECEEEVKVGKIKEFQPVRIPASPRYVAVSEGYVYWTNTGRRDSLNIPLDGGGTIGRAKLNGEEKPEEVEPAFICGEDKSEPNVVRVSNPQGIAANASHLYWANAAQDPVKRSIARAAIDGSAVEPQFAHPQSSRTPYGVGLSASHVYFDGNDELNDQGYIARVPLEGGEEENRFAGEEGLRGVAVDPGHVYWVAQREGAIGRANLELEGIEKGFIETEGTVNGLAVDAAHVYWSVNGDASTNPGNDLYRFEAASGALADLTPDHEAEDEAAGAAVQGLVGASADGSYLYLAANGNLDGPGPGGGGTCKGPVANGSGRCELYLLHEGNFSAIAPLRVEGTGPDSLDWVGTPTGAFSASYRAKTAFLGDGGKTLLFQSREKLTEYDNEGVPELYRYRIGDAAGIRCASCRPSGEAPGGGPGTGSIEFPGISPPNPVAAIASHILSSDGERVFFESAEALSPLDTNGQGGCPPLGSRSIPVCLDVYEWEAPRAGSSCEEGGPSYSPLNEGCIFLISSGKDRYPSLLADASASGDDVFFFTRQRLVGQDQDELQDVYDARVGGDLLSQNRPPAVVCESSEACHGPGQAAPGEASAGSESFRGPPNPKPRHKKHKHKKHHKQKRAKSKGRAGR